MNIDQLREKVRNNCPRLKLEQSLWYCLNHVENNHNDFKNIGLLWIDNENFICNSIILSRFLNVKPCSLIRRFHSNNFQSKKLSSQTRNQILNVKGIDIPNPNNWCLRRRDGFVKSLTKEELNDI
ncbi:hypothetical protein M9Y10_026472 [Tritrichomonas musculus]|uniref:Initiator binding domain-containing protein n=1 Tax=Tritrichomonas musculus TaxID=1915356 RepID=A0ABR2H7R4_9EUKA